MDIPVQYLVWLRRIILFGALLFTSAVVTMHLTGGSGGLILLVLVMLVAGALIFAFTWRPPDDYGE